MRGASRLDVGIAAAFVAAAVAEAAVRHHQEPGLLAFSVAGALGLGSLAVRRTRPLIPLGVIAGASVLGTALARILWPGTADDAGVWILATMLASYSLGAHTRGRVVALGVFLPLLVSLTADLTTRSGWSLLSGVVFITVFVGLLPTVVGRLVRVRHDRLRTLRHQHEQIVNQQRIRQQSAVLTERLRTIERLQPTLLHGLRALAEAAESSADPAGVESRARELLARTRGEVVALTAPVGELPMPEVPAVDHVRRLRAAAQPWAAVAGCAIAAALFEESTRVLAPDAPGGVAMLAGVAVGAPLALVWRRPVMAVAVAWVAAVTFSRLVVPLDGSLSGSALALATTFAVAALSRRRMAIAGLVLCWLCQLVGVGTDDPLGEAEAMVMCWFGGLALNEVSRLVEQTRANNEILSSGEGVAKRRAVVAERLRLARELHDSIGHSLTVVALHASAARRLAGTDPDRAKAVMATVAVVARDGATALEPEDALADIGALVERIRATGLVVDADIEDVALLDPPTRVVVHRLLQEALTNVLRHAPGSRATVSVRRDQDGLEVSVANTAATRAGGPPGSGRGLAGIRERVALYAGEVSFGPRPDGGFEVRALLRAARIEEVAT